MITWMQRHRKYLVITIWISTIAFIGAGFVGWGEYSYGNKSGAVAKVGNISITSAELQKSYSNLFNQYNQLFQGKFDEKQAKQFGLQKQALHQLVNQALVLNLAESYGLIVTDTELWNIIKSQPLFAKDGTFSKTAYEETLKQNHLTIKEYEASTRKELLIQKTLYLLASGNKPIEQKSLDSALSVSDKINYKLLTPAMISLTASDGELKVFWEKHQKEFKTEPSYDIAFVTQIRHSLSPSEKEISDYYEMNRQLLKDSSGKILSLADARSTILSALNNKATEKEALRLYIDYKKGALQPGITAQKVAINASLSPFSPELTKEIMDLNDQKPFLKPRKNGNEYIVVKLEKMNPSRIKTFDEAKTDVSALYTAEAKKTKLQELAQNTYKTFTGTTSDFITHADGSKLAGLSATEGSEFLTKLFTSKQKQGFVTLESGNVVIYNVLEQKLLQDKTIADENTVLKLKGNLLDQGLIKALESKYPVEIYVEGI
ncbi:MAG: SurA N-terminal domain-containing protein [Sulfuricurvum sp.]|uniref:peptidylprolyl isomerase n=1 Tax=Sulfuricurvum sp. TaxID=2025608 RepID=UPI0026130D37|nr:peptidylprolyl isomerase [Sulfuricurvum sp.]MDD5158528.1 SurA N-terminal domain-containing protein [Sulfuricurvum sp.]